MSVVALELNDTGLLLARGGQLSQPSPGYAHLDHDEVRVGEPARAAARLAPLNVVSNFWTAIDDRALPLLVARGRSNADLAFEHLVQVCAPLAGLSEPLVVLVRSGIQPRQLMLMLGLAREADLPLAGFIDAAVAAAASLQVTGRVIYVDLHLNETVLTAVEIGEQARRERFESVTQAGWSALADLWMKLVASRFVSRTRFDPLHDARSEQLLFDSVPLWLAQLETAEAFSVQVDAGGEPQSVELTREMVETEARELYSRILMAAHRLRRAGHRTTVALSHRVALLPGLLQHFQEFHDCDLAILPPGAAPLCAAELPLSWSVQDESATLVRSTPLPPPEVSRHFSPRIVQRASTDSEAALPSHALYRGTAHALGARTVVIGTGAEELGVNLRITEATAGISRLHCSIVRAGQDDAQIVDHSRYGTWLNDERVLGRAPVRAGDRVRVGNPGVSIELIAIG